MIEMNKPAAVWTQADEDLFDAMWSEVVGDSPGPIEGRLLVEDDDLVGVGDIARENYRVHVLSDNVWREVLKLIADVHTLKAQVKQLGGIPAAPHRPMSTSEREQFEHEQRRRRVRSDADEANASFLIAAVETSNALAAKNGRLTERLRKAESLLKSALNEAGLLLEGNPAMDPVMARDIQGLKADILAFFDPSA